MAGDLAAIFSNTIKKVQAFAWISSQNESDCNSASVRFCFYNRKTRGL